MENIKQKPKTKLSELECEQSSSGICCWNGMQSLTTYHKIWLWLLFLKARVLVRSH